jgi:hypothetical protein
MSKMLWGFSFRIFSKVTMSIEPSALPALTATAAGDAPYTFFQAG